MMNMFYATDNESGYPHCLMVLPNGNVVRADKGERMVQAKMTDYSFFALPDDYVEAEMLARMLGDAFGLAADLRDACRDLVGFVRRSKLRVGSDLLTLDMKISKQEDAEYPWSLRVRDSRTGVCYCYLTDYDDWHDAKTTGVFFLDALRDMGCNVDFNWEIQKN
jgi:hypothetical protein